MFIAKNKRNPSELFFGKSVRITFGRLPGRH